MHPTESSNLYIPIEGDPLISASKSYIRGRVAVALSPTITPWRLEFSLLVPLVRTMLFRKPIFEYLPRAGYLGNTILRTLLGRADRTNFDITISIRDEATANKFRKDEVKVRILDLDDSSALEQAAEESDGQLPGLKR